MKLRSEDSPCQGLLVLVIADRPLKANGTLIKLRASKTKLDLKMVQDDREVFGNSQP